MKLLILSDSHGDLPVLRDVLQRENDADAVIFLGDGLRDMEQIQDENPALKIYSVRGNCDFASFAPSEALGAFGGMLVFYTHGNGYEAKLSLTPLRTAARERGAEIVLFGHTHLPYYAYEDGLYMFNPGSVSMGSRCPSYGLMEINGGKVRFEHRDVKPPV